MYSYICVCIHNFVHALSGSMGAPMFGLGWLSFNSCVALSGFDSAIFNYVSPIEPEDSPVPLLKGSFVFDIRGQEIVNTGTFERNVSSATAPFNPVDT